MAAKVSALMESIEAYHAETISLPVKLGSYEEMRYTHKLVDVYQLPRSAKSPFQPYLPLIWIEGFDLMQREFVWLPFETVHTNYTLWLRVGAGSFNATSNGLASGNHLLEAVSHGLCEVVERDATTLWHQLDENSRRSTRINLETVNDPGCREVLELYERAGIAVAVWETTSDVGISSFLCTIMEHSDEPLRPFYPTSGMGCHPLRRIALLRALTEAAQSRLTAIAGSRDDLPRADYERFRNLDLLRANRAQIKHDGPRRDFTAGPDWNAETFEEDVEWELDMLRAVGVVSVIAVDLTKKEFGIPVVRVVIPGLEGVSSMPGYSPGARARARLTELT
jgi:ribosomal protein S12 methylthiotransferase accessory factor